MWYCCAVADCFGPDVNGAWREKCCHKPRSSVVARITAVLDVIVTLYYKQGERVQFLELDCDLNAYVESECSGVLCSIILAALLDYLKFNARSVQLCKCLVEAHRLRF